MTAHRLLPALQLSLRAAVAAAAALAISQILQLQFPLYAMITAVIVTDLSPARTRELAVPRFIGTLLGGALGVVLVQLLPANIWSIGAGIMVAMFISHMLKLQDAARLAGFVCGVVMLEHGDQSWAYAVYRLVETILGIATAVLVSVVPKLIRMAESVDGKST
jgi:uncharacterized membrane protein YgaE (UPF0421/DUF939 family)